MRCDVMAASSRLLQRVGVCVQECGGAEGLRLGAAGVRRGRGGGGEGNIPSGKVCPTQFVSHTRMAPCQMLTSKYLESHHIVPEGNTA